VLGFAFAGAVLADGPILVVEKIAVAAFQTFFALFG
jgi:hypothetical protein